MTVNTHSTQIDIGNGTTLPRDYTDAWEIEVAILDLCTEVCRRARKKRLMGNGVSLGISEADFDFRTGSLKKKRRPKGRFFIALDICPKYRLIVII